MSATRERDIENYLCRKVRRAGGDVRKVRWINRRGAPDRLVLLPDKVVWVELKAPGQKAKPHQLREHERLRKFGLVVLVIDSYEQIEELIQCPIT